MCLNSTLAIGEAAFRQEFLGQRRLGSRQRNWGKKYGETGKRMAHGKTPG
jgi:hypothetical protein